MAVIVKCSLSVIYCTRPRHGPPVSGAPHRLGWVQRRQRDYNFKGSSRGGLAVNCCSGCRPLKANKFARITYSGLLYVSEFIGLQLRLVVVNG